jgi:hypothetical protein
MKMDLKEAEWDCAGRIHATLNRNRWLGLEINFRVSKRREI